MLRRTGLSAAAIAAILGAAILLFGSPSPSPGATQFATTRPPTAAETPSATPRGPYAVVSGGELQGAQLVTAAFGWVRTGDGYRVTEDGGLTWRSVRLSGGGPVSSRDEGGADAARRDDR